MSQFYKIFRFNCVKSNGQLRLNEEEYVKINKRFLSYSKKNVQNNFLKLKSKINKKPCKLNKKDIEKKET